MFPVPTLTSVKNGDCKSDWKKTPHNVITTGIIFTKAMSIPDAIPLSNTEDARAFGDMPPANGGNYRAAPSFLR